MERLIDILYEPIFGVVLACVFCILFLLKKSPENKLMKLIAALLAMMILWRFFVAQVSTRYWAAILFPALALAGYVCYLPWWGIRFSRFLIIIVVVACLGKDFHLNWNNRSIINSAEAIKADAKKYSCAFVTEFENSGLLSRIGYYSGIRTVDNINKVDLLQCYESAVGVYDVFYIICENEPTEHLNFYEQVKLIGGELLFSRDKEMRGKKKIYVYKILIPPAEKVVFPTPELVKNGDFEQIVKRTNKDGSSYLFPQSWGRVSGFELEQDNPISGKYSLRVKGLKDMVLYSYDIRKIGQNGIMRFTVKSGRDANIRVIGRGYEEPRKVAFQKTLLNLEIPDDGAYQLQVPLKFSELTGANTIQYFWYISAPNGLIMDDVEFYPAVDSDNRQ